MQLPKTPSFRLDGRRALVAGASSGIGMGCAVALAEAGAHVTLAARRADALAEIVAELQAAGHQAEAMVLDVADQESMTAQLKAAEPYNLSLIHI